MLVGLVDERDRADGGGMVEYGLGDSNECWTSSNAPFHAFASRGRVDHAKNTDLDRLVEV